MVGGRRCDGGRLHAGGGGVSSARLCKQATVAERSDVLSRQVIAKGEGGSICAMHVSEQITKLAHRMSAEGWHVDFGDGTDAMEVRNGRMGRMGDVLHGR